MAIAPEPLTIGALLEAFGLDEADISSPTALEVDEGEVNEGKLIAARRAASQRAAWRRQGACTRADYCLTRGALSRDLQDAVVAMKRASMTRKRIMAQVVGRGVSEYSVKRLLRVYAYDPEAFDVEDGILIRR